MRLFFLLCWLLFAPVAAAQESTHQLAREAALDSAPVEVDGKVLFRVRGIEALRAADRAAAIAHRIETLAADRSFRPEAVRVEDQDDASLIAGSRVVVMGLDDEDARLAGVRRSLLAPVYAQRIRRAIVEYREARTRAHLLASAARAGAAIAIAAVLLALLLWLLRRGEAMLQRAFDRRVGELGTESRRILRVEGIWKALRAAVGGVRVVAVLFVTLFLLQYVFTQFPWTRGTGLHLFEYVSGPLAAAGKGIVAAIPDLILLASLFLITRYVLSLLRFYFSALQSGAIQLHGFEPEWAHPTHNLVRIVVIALALVIAYPLVPGSDSEAFKGLSIFAGVMLSLASTSAIANVVAGYMIIYRRSFRVGDRVKIGDVIGDVTEMRLQVTHIRTIKNEESTLPNSVILGSEVLNYSKPARDGRLILHTEVGIGYEVPWRQVEALLIDAARRTPGLLQEPPPFVLQRELGGFAITYQINAYTDRAQEMPQIYAHLHRSILDRFNEHGVQIMVPAYEGDPETPKIVAQDQWFAAPAEKEER